MVHLSKQDLLIFLTFIHQWNNIPAEEVHTSTIASYHWTDCYFVASSEKWRVPPIRTGKYSMYYAVHSRKWWMDFFTTLWPSELSVAYSFMFPFLAFLSSSSSSFFPLTFVAVQREPTPQPPPAQLLSPPPPLRQACSSRGSWVRWCASWNGDPKIKHIKKAPRRGPFIVSSHKSPYGTTPSP